MLVEPLHAANTFSGASTPSADTGDRHQAAALVEHAHQALPRQRARATQLLAAREGQQLGRRERHLREVEPGVHGDQHLARASAGQRRAHLVERVRVLDAERAADGARQRGEIRARCRAARRGRGPARGCRCRPSSAPRSVAIGRAGSASSHADEVEPVDRDPARPQLGLLAVAGELVRLAPGDAHGRIVGRHLLDLAAKRIQRRLDLAPAAGLGRTGSARRRGRRWWIGRRSRPARGIPWRSPRWYSTSRVAWPTKTGSTPAAKGSSVPPWPTRLTPASRRTRATMSCEVGPGSLATTMMPSALACGSATALVERPTRSLEHRGIAWAIGQRHGGAGRACVPAATEDAGEHGRVRAALAGADADLGPLAVLRKR